MKLKKLLRVSSLSVSTHDDTQHTNIAEKRLLRAILSQWFKDLVFELQGSGNLNKKGIKGRNNPLKWLERKNLRPWSLNWVLCCLYNDWPARREKLEEVVRLLRRGKSIKEIIGIHDLDFAEYNQSETTISFLNRRSSDSLLHIKKSDSTEIH